MRPFHNKTLTPWNSVRTISSLQDLYYYNEMLEYKYDTLVAHKVKLNPTGDEEIEEVDENDVAIKGHSVTGYDQVQISE